MVKGYMYCLNSVLEIEGFSGSLYLLESMDYEELGEVSFGRGRKVSVSTDSYIVKIDGDEVELQKIDFSTSAKFDYLEFLKGKGISYKTPSKLPECNVKGYTRFESAIGYACGSGKTRGYFGRNGFLISDVGYIGSDKYEEYECFLKNSNFSIDGNAVNYMTGFVTPNEAFISSLLDSEIKVSEGEELKELLRAAGISEDMMNIKFEFLEEIHNG